MAAKKNPELEELVQLQSHVPTPAAGAVGDVIPTPQAVAAASTSPAPQVHLPPPTGENGLIMTQPGMPGQANIPQPTGSLTAPREVPQAAIPQQGSVASLPSMQPMMAGIPQPPPSPVASIGAPTPAPAPATVAHDDEHDHDHEDEFFDPDNIEDFEFEGPTPTANPGTGFGQRTAGFTTAQQAVVAPPTPPSKSASDPNAPPFDVDPPAGTAVPATSAAGGEVQKPKRTRRTKEQMAADAAAAAAGTAAPATQPPTAAPTGPVMSPPPPLPSQPAPVAQQSPQTQPPAPPAGMVNLPCAQPAFVMPTSQGAFNPLQPPLGPLMQPPAPSNPETQVSEALMAYIEGTARQVLVDIGVALLHDPSQRVVGNPTHDAIYAMRWENENLHERPVQELNKIQRALAAHQVWVAGVENWWESRYQYLAKELDAQMFRNRDGYNGNTKQEKENDCQSRDPNMRALRHHMMVAQGVALALRGMADRFQHLDNGLKRTIDTMIAEMSRGMR